jgi:hypothetical protein
MLTPVAMYLYYDRKRLARQNRQNREESSIATKEERAMIVGQSNPETPGIVPILFFLALFAFAAYLSWQCNSNKPETISPAMKIIYAIGAGFDNFTYILNYYVFQRNTKSICNLN